MLSLQKQQVQDRAREVMRSMDAFFKKDARRDSKEPEALKEGDKRVLYRPASAKNRGSVPEPH